MLLSNNTPPQQKATSYTQIAYFTFSSNSPQLALYIFQNQRKGAKIRFMDKFKTIGKNKMDSLPIETGVYAFKNGGDFLYVGKTVNIKKRVKNHFNQPSYRDNLFLDKITSVGYIKTDSEIEALILEANLIKKFQPKFNVTWRDDKNYFYVAITGLEEYPRVFITHQPRLKTRITKSETRKKSQKSNLDIGTSTFFRYSGLGFRNSFYIGPFTDGKAIKQTLKILRRIFPFYSVKKHPPKLCPYCHLGLCPGPKPDLKEYGKNIRNLTVFLNGEKKSVIVNLKKEMTASSKNQNFEKAARTRDKIFYLEDVLAHKKVLEQNNQLQDNWKNTEKMLKKIIGTKNKISRIEGYDISNIQGKQATGSMVVFINGRAAKDFYRKFKIKTLESPNDVAMLKEILGRRLKHSEWQCPEMILIDGGKAQLNAAINSKSQSNPSGSSPRIQLNSKSRLKIKDPRQQLGQIQNSKSQIQNIKILSIAKKNNDLYIEGQNKPIPLKNLPREIYNLILQVRDESHRFAKSYHEKLRKLKLTKK